MGSISDSNTAAPYVQTNIGLMSTVHFPIKRSRIVPSIGAQVTMASNGGIKSTNASMVIGISWFLGFGSINIGFNVGNGLTTTGGYTLQKASKLTQ